MEDPENQVLDVIELLLTAHIYNDNDQLDENDLPPHIRKNYWNSKERRVDRPIIVSETAVNRIYEIPHGWSLIKTLPFVAFEEFGARLNLTVLNLAAKWFATQDSLSRINQNPALAFYYSKNDSLDVDYERVRRLNKPKEMDREWIFSLIDEIAGEGEEAEDMLKLVAISAPEDVRESLDKLVLTQEQVAGNREDRQGNSVQRLFEGDRTLRDRETLVCWPTRNREDVSRASPFKRVRVSVSGGATVDDYLTISWRDVQEHRKSIQPRQAIEPLHPVHR